MVYCKSEDETEVAIVWSTEGFINMLTSRMSTVAGSVSTIDHVTLKSPP
jgi:hypothetical protein